MSVWYANFLCTMRYFRSVVTVVFGFIFSVDLAVRQIYLNAHAAVMLLILTGKLLKIEHSAIWRPATPFNYIQLVHKTNHKAKWGYKITQCTVRTWQCIYNCFDLVIDKCTCKCYSALLPVGGSLRNIWSDLSRGVPSYGKVALDLPTAPTSKSFV